MISNAVVFWRKVKPLVEDNPNDAELGAKVRVLMKETLKK